MARGGVVVAQRDVQLTFSLRGIIKNDPAMQRRKLRPKQDTQTLHMQ